MKPEDVSVTAGWREAFPEARVGLLALENVENPVSHAGLQQRVDEVEKRLRQGFAGTDRTALAALPVIQAYQRHFRTFGQTYHVQRQLESVALKGRSIASRGALVLAMFAVEVETLLLTAGHDLDAVKPPLELDCSNAEDRFTGIGGQEYALRPRDMLIRDAGGIISAVVYGPDARTRINEGTRRVLFTTYAPAGIGDGLLRDHLERIRELVRVVAPESTTSVQRIYPA